MNAQITMDTMLVVLWSELYGRVRTVESCVPTAQIPLGGLNAGTYFIKLLIGGEPVTTEQLIIK